MKERPINSCEIRLILTENPIHDSRDDSKIGPVRRFADILICLSDIDSGAMLKFYMLIGFVFYVMLFVMLFSRDFFQQNDSLVLQGPYLGQKPPGMTPEIFAPEILQANPSWFWHGSPVFSPDGNEMYWTKYVVGKGMRLWHMVQNNNNWLAPKKAAFACDCNENNPFYSEDGNTIYYMSEKAGGPLFFVNRTSTGWLLPRNIVLQLPENTGWGWEFSFTKNLELYLELMNDNHFDLYYATSTKGRYTDFKNMGSKINSLDMETTPFIDPDKQFIIFSSDRPDGFGGADLYISFRNSDDTWTESINMGIEINSACNDLWPSVTSDKKYFFFCRLDRAKKGYQPYLVDAIIIEKLKPKNL